MNFFFQKEFDLDSIPDDVLSTRAAGVLSQQVLFDMCQGKYPIIAQTHTNPIFCKLETNDEFDFFLYIRLGTI